MLSFSMHIVKHFVTLSVKSAIYIQYIYMYKNIT